jgi:hypothetical protein
MLFIVSPSATLRLYALPCLTAVAEVRSYPRTQIGRVRVTGPIQSIFTPFRFPITTRTYRSSEAHRQSAPSDAREVEARGDEQHRENAPSESSTGAKPVEEEDFGGQVASEDACSSVGLCRQSSLVNRSSL